MTEIILDIPLFRLRFPQYADDSVYTDEAIQNQYEENKCIISNIVNRNLSDECLERSLYLLLAHTLFFILRTNKGIDSGRVLSSTIKNISVTRESTRLSSDSEYSDWLKQTLYGQKLNMILYVHSRGGLYTAGSRPKRLFFGQ
jgi:hypothetical protein